MDVQSLITEVTGRAEKIAAQGDAAFRAQGVSVARANRSVDVVSADVISDANGTAVVAVLRNTGERFRRDVIRELSCLHRGRLALVNDGQLLSKLEIDRALYLLKDGTQRLGRS